jgi:hypothetical protein
MTRFQLWLTTAVMFLLPALIFAQGTSGSPCSKIKNGGTKTTGGKKGAARPELARKGAANAPKTNASGNAPKLEAPIGSATGGAGSGRAGKLSGDGGKKKVEPTDTARKKPPRPRQGKEPKKEPKNQ